MILAPCPCRAATDGGGSAAAPADAAALLGWLRQRGASGHLRVDSRAILPGDVFVALRGTRTDGRAHIAAALSQGAVAALADGADGWAVPAGLADAVRTVPGLGGATLGELAARWYGEPSRQVPVVGVTGTNGKTSITQWIGQLLAAADGRRCGVIGTLGAAFPGEPPLPVQGAPLTTPDAATLQRQVRDLLAAGAQAVSLEVSSIGLHQGRVAGMAFDTAVFTNLTRDHLDYHGTLAAYAAAKAQLFTWPGLRHAVVNLDDAAGRHYARLAIGRGVATTGIRVDGAPAADPTLAGAAGPDDGGRPVDGLAATLQARAVRPTATGLRFEIVWARADGGAAAVEADVPLVGMFNVANVLCALAAALALGVPFHAAVAALPRLVPPPGRMERVGGEGGPLAVVDYAHTPDAIAQALAALRPLAAARGGALWIVFGAGGDRDPGKRAPMGAAAARGADRVLVTSDNPRGEPPVSIVAAVLAGARAEVGASGGGAARLDAEPDRAAAIARALREAATADVVLVAGKGHEPYQEIAGVRRPFSDLAQVRQALMARVTGAAPGTGPDQGPGGRAASSTGDASGAGAPC